MWCRAEEEGVHLVLDLEEAGPPERPRLQVEAAADLAVDLVLQARRAQADPSRVRRSSVWNRKGAGGSTTIAGPSARVR